MSGIDVLLWKEKKLEYSMETLSGKPLILSKVQRFHILSHYINLNSASAEGERKARKRKRERER